MLRDNVWFEILTDLGINGILIIRESWFCSSVLTCWSADDGLQLRSSLCGRQLDYCGEPLIFFYLVSANE